MNNKKRIISCFICCALISSLSTQVFAEHRQTSAYVSDEALAEQVHEIMLGYNDNKNNAIASLENIGVELISEPSVEEYYGEPIESVSPRYLSPSKATLSVYSFKKADDSNRYYLQYSLQFSEKEARPGPLDYVSIEYNSNYANYYSSSGDSNGISTVKDRSTGIVLFNVEDDLLYATNSTYGTAVVSVTTSNVDLDFAAKLEHTYRKTSFGGSVGGEVGYEFGTSSITGALTFSLDIDNTTESWQLMTDNAVSV